MKFATFLLAMVEPLLAKILVSLGFSVVTIVGMNTVVGQLKDSIVSGMNSLPGDMLNYALFAGVGTGIGIIFGAIATRLVIWNIKNATTFLGKNPG